MITIEKYGLAALLLANLLVGFEQLQFVGNVLFYVILGLAAIVSVFKMNVLLSTSNMKKFGVIYAFLLTHLIYQFTFGLFNYSIDACKYVLAKSVVFLITVLSVRKNYNYYHTKFVMVLSTCIAGLLVIGFLFNNKILEGRMTLGFGNPNNASSVAAIAFIGFLMVDVKKFHYLGIIVSLGGVMLGGSRTCLAMCLIVAGLKYGMSLKKLIFCSLGLFSLIYILSLLDLNISAIDRFVDVVESGNYIGSREDPRRATMMMISERPIAGWGFKSGIQGAAADITELGSHNGYLDIIKAMGYPFSLILFVICLYRLYLLRGYIKSESVYYKYYFAILIMILGAAMYESYLIGVNNFTTNMFFISAGILEYGKYSGISNFEQK